MTRIVQLGAPADFEAWRREARGLLARGVVPVGVRWKVLGDADTGDFFAGGNDSADSARRANTQSLQPAVPTPRVPRSFINLGSTAICHRDPFRFDLLYRLLWRLQDEANLMRVAADADVHYLTQLVKAVRRDKHKMTAFVRFREVGTEDGPHYLAWFEPENHILEAVAPFFVKRFAGMRWSILTPDGSVHWDGKAVLFGPGARRADVPADDALEHHWRIYFSSIFNPARLNTRAMKREMPVRYWHNLPEAPLIPDLVRKAAQRTEAMLDASAALPVQAASTHAATHLQPEQHAHRSLDARVKPGHDGGRPASLHSGLGQDCALPMPPAIAALDRDRRSHTPAAAAGPSRDCTVPAPPVIAGLEPAIQGPFTTLANLADIRQALGGCRACDLWRCATGPVAGEGPFDATVVMVGEQPGDKEDLQGRPFTGPAGQVLDEGLAAAGLPRASLYLTNAVKHFKFQQRGKIRLHRQPDRAEVKACRPWLESELTLIRPKLIVALGATAASSLAGRPVKIAESRGRWLDYGGGAQLFITVHPSYLLRLQDPAAAQAEKQRFHADLTAVRQKADELSAALAL